MNNTTHTISCPNCTREHKLLKAGGWRTLSSLEAITSITLPMLIGLLVLVVMCHTGLLFAISFEPWQMLATVVATTIGSFPLVTCAIVRYSRNNCARLGIEIFVVDCECENSFTIVRQIDNSPREIPEDSTSN